ncbi:hypothetical protein GQ457_14G026690 [Hibiscus cannabinus]
MGKRLVEAVHATNGRRTVAGARQNRRVSHRYHADDGWNGELELVNISGVLAPNAASFVARKQLNETTPFGAFRRSPVARRRPPAAVRPSEPKR